MSRRYGTGPIWDRNQDPSWWEWHGGSIYLIGILLVLGGGYVLYACGGA